MAETPLGTWLRSDMYEQDHRLGLNGDSPCGRPLVLDEDTMRRLNIKVKEAPNAKSRKCSRCNDAVIRPERPQDVLGEPERRAMARNTSAPPLDPEEAARRFEFENTCLWVAREFDGEFLVW